MISTTKEFDNRIRADTRTFYARILVYGTPLEVGIKSITFYKGSCGNVFTVGAIYAPYAEIILDAPITSINQKAITIEIGLETNTDSEENPSIEYVQIGSYSKAVIKNTTSSSSVTVSGYLSNELKGLYESKISFPATIQAVLEDITSQTNITINTTLGTSGTIETQPKGYTYQEVLGYLAGCLGGFVTEDSTGKVVICAYSTIPTRETEAGEYVQMPEFVSEKYEVTGITVKVEEDGETDDGDVVEGKSYATGTDENRITVFNPFMTQSLFDSMKDNVIGLSWHSGIANLSHGDIRLEGTDVISVTDIAGDTYIVPCMSLVIHYDGGVWCDIEAPGEEEVETSTQGPITQQMERYFVELVLAKEMIAKRAKVEDLEATNAYLEKLSANSATITDLNATNAKIENLEVNKVDIKDLEVGYAKIDLANVNNAWIENGIIKDGAIKEATIGDGAITNAKIADATIEAAKIKSINADNIVAGTIKTGRLIITGPNGEDSIVKAINLANGISEAEVNSKKIQAASIEVADLSAFEATLALFKISQNAIYSGKTSIEDPHAGIYISTNGIGVGDGSLIGSKESPFQVHADGGFKLQGKNASITFDPITGELSIASGSLATKEDLEDIRDEITTLLRIESSRGTVFKNDQIATVLSVVIYHGKQRITDSATMKATYGSSAYLQWKWQRLDDDSFGVLSASDSRFGDNGFTFTLSPEDVDTKVTFMCELIN